MKFGDYLKLCRKKYNLTQVFLVQELYHFDDIFSGLDIRTLARWEHNTTKPTLAKQVSIVKLLKKYSTHIFPCFSNIDDIEEKLYLPGISSLLGNSKEHIINFPTHVSQVDSTKIVQVGPQTKIDLTLNMSQSIFDGLTSEYFKITQEHLKEWSLHLGNLFLIAENKGQFMGMFFTLRLQPKIFQQIINFEMKITDLNINDFASMEEEACLLPFSFFAYNKNIAALLFIKYYAYLIENQDTIAEIGSTPLLKSGKKLMETMHLQHVEDKLIEGITLCSYCASLEKVLINEDVLKLIYQE